MLRRSHSGLPPVARLNRYDAIRGIDAFLADPLGVPPDHIPMGITFPSAKDRSWAQRHPNAQCCQILVPTELASFAAHIPGQDDPPLDPGAADGARGDLSAACGEATGWARHAPPHALRRDAGAYKELKAKWEERLLAQLHR